VPSFSLVLEPCAGLPKEGTTTTPFDICVRNEIDRFHFVLDVIALVPGLAEHAVAVVQAIQQKLIEHEEYISRNGIDLPEITG